MPYRKAEKAAGLAALSIALTAFLRGVFQPHLQIVRRTILVALGALLIVGLILSGLNSPKLPAPLLLPMSMPKTNSGFSVFGGNGGFMFVMPDGSLWRWGADNNGKLPTLVGKPPTLVDDKHHWAKAFYEWSDWIAEDNEGGLWESGIKLNLPAGTNGQVIGLTGGNAYSLALQSNGTMLGWESGSGRGTTSTPFILAQTNLSWRAVSACGPPCLGISTDGRLWSWQRQGFYPLTFSSPVQESTDTNWIGVAEASYAWTSSGHLWGAPVDHLNSSNAVEGRFALGYTTHEIRSDGTLWAVGSTGVARTQIAVGVGISMITYGYRPSSGTASAPLNSAKSEWHRVGNRSDWVSVWSYDETYFGLTADGTVWSWGYDWGAGPVETLHDRLARLWKEFHDRIRPPPPGTGPFAAGASRFLSPPYQKEPRPFMKFKPAPEPAQGN